MKPTDPTSKVLVTKGPVPARKKVKPSLRDDEYKVVSTGEGRRSASPPVVFVVVAALVPGDG